MKLKRVLWSILLVLVIAGATICYIRWDAWFYIPPEPNYELLDTPQRVIVTPGEEAIHQRNISWVTGTDSTQTLLLLTPDSVWVTQNTHTQNVKTHGGNTIIYNAQLRVENTPLVYRIANASGKEVFIQDTLYPYNAKQDTLIYIGDIQDTEKGMSDSIILHIAKRYPNPASWIFGGDVIERGYDKYWKIWYESIKPFCTHTPLIAVTGNHEHTKGVFKELDPRWVPTFNFPHNSPVLTGSNFFTDFNHCRIVCINTDGMDRIARITQTREWLKQTLLNYTGFKIVVFHHAIYPARAGRFHPIMYTTLKGILEDPKYQVALVLQGHDHSYARRWATTSNSPSTPAYVISTFSNKCYPNKFDDSFDKLGSGTKWYQVISISADTLHYQSFLTNDTLYDDFKVIRHKEGTLSVQDLGREIPEVHTLTFPNSRKGEKAAKAYAKGKADRLEYLRSRSTSLP